MPTPASFPRKISETERVAVADAFAASESVRTVVFEGQSTILLLPHLLPTHTP